MAQSWKRKVRCCNCGTYAKKDTQSYFGKEPYQGNLQIVQDRTFKRKDQEGNTIIVYDLSLWDGESYTLYAGKFCTNRCAIEWANDRAPDLNFD